MRYLQITLLTTLVASSLAFFVQRTGRSPRGLEETHPLLDFRGAGQGYASASSDDCEDATAATTLLVPASQCPLNIGESCFFCPNGSSTGYILTGSTSPHGLHSNGDVGCNQGGAGYTGTCDEFGCQEGILGFQCVELYHYYQQ
jgi:hypothetical protein